MKEEQVVPAESRKESLYGSKFISDLLKFMFPQLQKEVHSELVLYFLIRTLNLIYYHLTSEIG